MKDLLLAIFLVSVLTIVHFGLCAHQFAHRGLVDFVVHKIGVSLVITSFLTDLLWSNFFITFFLAMFWFAWAFRAPLANVLKANWIAFGKPALQNLFYKISSQANNHQEAKPDQKKTVEEPSSEAVSPDLSEI